MNKQSWEIHDIARKKVLITWLGKMDSGNYFKSYIAYSYEDLFIYLHPAINFI